MRSQSKKKKELNHYLNSKIKEKPKFHEIILELQTIEMGHRRRITQTTKESSQQINKKKGQRKSIRADQQLRNSNSAFQQGVVQKLINIHVCRAIPKAQTPFSPFLNGSTSRGR